MKRCGNCGRSWTGDDGKIHCGAGVDTDEGNPIWAERKYSLAGILALADGTAKGMDCEDMDPNDGADCKIWMAT